MTKKRERQAKRMRDKWEGRRSATPIQWFPQTSSFDALWYAGDKFIRAFTGSTARKLNSKLVKAWKEDK